MSHADTALRWVELRQENAALAAEVGRLRREVHRLEHALHEAHSAHQPHREGRRRWTRRPTTTKEHR